MKHKLITRLVLSAAVFAALTFFSISPLENQPINSTEVVAGEVAPKVPKAQRIAEAMALEFEKTVDPALGRVPRERLLDAVSYMESIAQPEARLSAAGSVWKEQGPGNVGGRTRAIMVDQNDPTRETVYAGSVSGGLWVTNTISSERPNWRPVNDLFENLSVTCIAADPANPATIYFGTGEGYFNADAVAGLGLWKSTNAGATWNALPSTTGVLDFYFCQRLIITGNGTVLVATRLGGLQRSTDGGATWTKVLGNGTTTGAMSDICFDVELASNGDIYATLNGSIHKSTDDGATFGPAATLPVTAKRIELACAPSDANYLYAAVEDNFIVEGILRSTDAGATWVAMTEPVDADPGIPATDFSRGQAWYNLAIAVDPNNRDKVVVGGIDLFASADGGANWNQLTHWYGGFGAEDVHADQHYIYFSPENSDVVYFGNDGGVYSSNNMSQAAPTFEDKSHGYNTAQFYACDAHPEATSRYFIAGAQDNGTHRFSEREPGMTREITGGDGAFCHIDQNEAQFQFTQYVYNNYYRSVDGGKSFTSISYGNSGRFINPTDYDDIPNIMYAAHQSNNYLRWDDPRNTTNFTVVPVSPFGGMPTSVTCSPNVAHRVYFGFGNGQVFRVDSAHATPISVELTNGLPNRYISHIEVQEGDENHLLLVFSNYGVPSVFESFDGGASWVNVEGNLPDMPVRWAIFNPTDNDKAIIATETGVWHTEDLNGSSTIWTPIGGGFPNVRTDMIKVRKSDNYIIAATHGRGLFGSDIFTNQQSRFSVRKKVVYTGKPVEFVDLSYKANSWEWDFGDGSAPSYDENPTHTYSTPGLYSVELKINGNTSNFIRAAYIQVLPDLGTPFLPANGGDFETNPLYFGADNLDGTPWERGSSAVNGKHGTASGSNAWVTSLTDANYYNNTHANLFTPSFNMTASGAYSLEFRARYLTEQDYDGFRVEYSTDKGDNWSLLGATQAGWYNFANTAEKTAFPIDEAYFSGSQTNNFRRYSYDVSFLNGNADVAFRFVFRADGGTQSVGVAIDDFELNGPPNGPNALPVEMSALFGEWSQQDVLLSWSTFEEVNNAGFDVERSTDGSHFEAIGFVPGRIHSDREHSYVFTDRDATEAAYFYRLRQHDLDGNTTLSNTVMLQRSGLETLAIEAVYPTPSASYVNIRLTDVYEGNAKLDLVDIAGNIVDSRSWNGASGTEFRMDFQREVPAGIYFLKLRLADEVLIHKITRI